MAKKCIQAYIAYSKNVNGIYDIEIINNEDCEDINIIEINKQCKLSYNLYNEISTKIEYMNDDKYTSIVDSLNKIKNEEIELLKKIHNEELILQNERIINQNKINIDNETNKRQCLENNFNEKLSIEINKIKNETTIELNNLKNQIELYKYQLQEKERLNSEENLYENVCKNIYESQTIISSKIDNIDKYFNKHTPSSISGEIGEEFIFDYLSSYIELTDATLKKVNGKSNAGDILLQYNNLNCCIEVKNHVAPITQANIKRFLQTDIANPNYNCGIFISIKSEFAEVNNIKHFDIRYDNNKPSIFLSNFIARPNDIIFAIKILDFIVHNNKCNSEDVNSYISMLTNNLDMLNSLIEINSDNIKNLNKSNTLIKNKQMEIEDLLKISKPIVLTCSKCNKVFKKQTNLTKHGLTCNV